jgi:hypothetical protein
VGEGAKRTRGVACEDELKESRSAKVRWYGRSEDIVKPRRRAFRHFDTRYLSHMRVGLLYLNPVVFGHLVVKP